MRVDETPAVRPRTARRSGRFPLARLAVVLAAIPFLLLVLDILRGTLGVDPVESGIRRTGWWALTLLVGTLAVTPVRRITGWNRLIEVRKPLGVAAFCYACIHLLGYVAIEQWFGWSYILEDIIERPFITAGFTAFLLLLPLAATSTRGSIRRLGGKGWRRLHRLIYPASLLAVLHYFWLVKADTRPPLLYALIVVVLLTLRVANPFERRPKRRQTHAPAPREPSTAAAGMD